MQLGILLAVLASIMISENAPAKPVGEVSLRVTLVLGSCLSVVLLATWGSLTLSHVIRSCRHDAGNWPRWFGRLQQGHLILWLAVTGLVIYGLHWPQIVRYNWHLDRIPLLRDVLILAPVWIPLLCSWAAFYEVERAARQQTAACDSRADRMAGGGGRAAYVWLRARHYLGLCLVPVLMLLCFQDLVYLLQPQWRESSLSWLVYVVPLVGITLALPELLSRIWKTAPLTDPRLRSRLADVTNQLGVRTRDFRIWKTDDQLLNAAVTGLLPALRYVFITDALLGLLRVDEILSVVTHELGHVRRRHLWLRMLLLALPVWILANVQAFAPGVGECCSVWIEQHLGNPVLANAVLIPFLTIGYAAIALGMYSHALEHDADLYVYEAGYAGVFCSALARLSYESHTPPDRRTWLHPSTAARIHLLQRAQRDADVAQHYRRRVNRFNAILIAAWLVTPLLLGLGPL